MRSFDERIAEINRRSQKILKERKKRRKHILMVCIPLVLCITLFAALFPRDTKTAVPEEPAINKAPMDGPAGGWDGSSSLSVLRIDVSVLGFSQSYTDADDVMLIYDLLCSYTQYESESFEEPTEAVQDEDYMDGGAAPPMDADPSIDFSPIQYSITLMMQSDHTTEYVLTGNTLRNLTTDQEVILSDNEVKKLKTALGIPHP